MGSVAAVTAITAARRITPVRTRRSWIWIAGSAALILGGSLVNVVLFTSSVHPHDVFIVTHNIPRGSTLAAQDLTTLSLAGDQASVGIASTAPADVIGKVATVDLPKGSLITPASLAATQQVPTGQALVGISLKPAQLPAQPLTAGDHVEIVPIAATNTPSLPVTTSTISGIVSDTADNQQSGTTIVDVYVSETVAADLTSRAAAGTVALYLTAAGG
jgi:hypothetical protein